MITSDNLEGQVGQNEHWFLLVVIHGNVLGMTTAEVELHREGDVLPLAVWTAAARLLVVRQEHAGMVLISGRGLEP